MAEPFELLRAVAARIEHDEVVRRLGRAVPVAVPEGAPPITALAARSFPLAVRERRMSVLRALGWVDEVIEECVPGSAPSLPAGATLEDHVAVVGAARRVRAVDGATATLAWALGADVVGAEPVRDGVGWWDALLDATADDVDARWRERSGVGGPSFAPLEAVALAGDAFFGRRRRTDPWTSLREATRWAGTTKRRLVG